MTSAGQYIKPYIKPLILDALLLIVLLVVTRTYYASQISSRQSVDEHFWKAWRGYAMGIEEEVDSAYSVVAADIDRDGDMDVLGTALFDGDMTWWENTAGDGSSWTKHRARHIP